MQITKKSKNLILSSQEGSASLEVGRGDASLYVEVSYDGKTEKIEKPGEFEIAGLEIIGKEITQEPKKGFINTLFLDVDGVKVLYVDNVSEELYEWVKTLPFIDILVVTFTDNLKEVSNKIDPSKIILLSSTELADADVKKLGVSQVNKSKTFKFKESDFQSDEENQVAELLSLN